MYSIVEYSIVARSSVECYHSSEVFGPYSRTSRDSGPSCNATSSTNIRFSDRSRNVMKEKIRIKIKLPLRLLLVIRRFVVTCASDSFE